MAATAGKVIVANTTTAIPCNGGSDPCTAGELAQIIDLVGWGNANFFEGAAAAPATSTTLAIFRAVNGCTETDNNSADFTAATPAPRNSATTPAPCGGPPPLPTLNVNDVALAEGNPPGTTTFTFTVSLTAPAGPGGVTFDIATADGTAQDDNPATEDNDYVPQSLTGQTIPAGSSTYAFNVTVNRDTTSEPNETFFVNVTNVTGATAGDTQGQGTIQNDDVSVVFIHDVQGSGAMSPIVGSTVTVVGIVTGVRTTGFFVQEEDTDALLENDPATSEGIFVFTSGAPPAAAAFGARVQVTGTVAEFVPGSDPQQPPLTELTSSTTVRLNDPGVFPLPTPVALTPTFPNPAGPFDQLERVEGMRVSASSMTVVAPSDGSINEANNTGTSNGRFHAVVTGVARPFREPGIQAPDVPPAGSIPPIPRWDTNPELIRIESATINSQPILTVKTSDTVAPIVGPLDYGFRRYAIYPDGTNTITVTPGTLPTTVTAPTAQEFTVASWNMFHLYDTVGGQSVSAAAYADRLNKASIAIRNNLQMPDILGVQEVENLTVLQDLATKINNDAVANSQPNPQYVAYLSEGNDPGGIDVGYLVKSAPVAGGAPRVAVNSVTQIGKTTQWTQPNGTPDDLHDRPPLVLDAVINRAPGASFPVIVINNHLKSLIGVDSTDPHGPTTEGDRNRRKRQLQADFLADYIQGRITANANEHIILVGDYNAFEFNDGFADVMNTITGTPPPPDQTVVCTICPQPPNTEDGVDQVNPNLTNLVNTPPPSERYSYVFDGNAQNLDHVVVSATVIADTTARRIEHPRIGADYPETERANASSPLRVSEHDPVVGYFAAISLSSADVSVTKTDNVDPVNAGQNFFYTVTVDNAGPDAATNVSWSDALPAGTTFVSLSQPGGWTCTTPAIGANGTVSCSIASLGVGSAAFNITVAVNAGLASGTVLSNTATVTSTTSDPNGANNSDTETTTVATSADLLLSKTDTPDPVNAGSNLSYQITLTNNGPSNAASATFTDALPAGTTFVSLSTTGPWTCTTPAVGATGTVTCTSTSFGVTVDFFTIVVNVDPNLATGTVLSNTATLSSATPDPNGANNSDTETTTVATSADLLLSKTDSPDPVNAGSNLSYTITLTNSGPSNATTAVFTDTLPAGTTFVSLSTTGTWTCTTPAVGATGTVTCNNASFGVTVDFFTLVVNVNSGLASGTVLSNTATLASATPDPNGANNSATATTTVGAGSADLSVTKFDSPDPVNAGANLVYSITVTNAGPSAATSVTLADTVPVGTTFVAFTAPGGWTCSTPAIGATGAISCTNPTLGVTSALFTLTVNVDPTLLAGTVLSNTITVSSATTDPNGANNSDTETTTVTTSADLLLSKTDNPDPVNAGSNINYQITITNNGPSNAAAATFTDTLPAGTTFVSLATTGPWTCTTPAVGATGTITCTNPSFGVTVDFFNLVVQASAALPSGTVLTNTATVTSTTTDPNAANNSSTATTTIGVGSADVSIAKTDSPDPVNAGGDITYTITVTNAGPTNAASASMSDTLPAGTTFVSVSAPAGWTCTTPAVGAGGTVSCTNPSFATGSAVFSLVARVAAATTPGTVITNTATVSSTTADPNLGNESATTTTSVVSPANVSGTKTVTGTFVPGGSITYTIVLTNNGPSTQGDNPGDEFVDVLPASLTLVSATATGGTAVATPATRTVTWNGSLASGASVTITINATIRSDATPGTSVANQGTINYDADGNGTNESTRQTDSPAAPGSADATTFTVTAPAEFAAIPTLDEWMLLALAALMAAVAAFVLKR
ncbi:MAG TPA: endonuclease/exonuclease/phosphatase family protein [Thermoanaerobaculia bacterium]|nr:endonuclease/exonuclease/phosphatase family protein [Thermoanaerobaculia bacterium]